MQKKHIITASIVSVLLVSGGIGGCVWTSYSKQKENSKNIAQVVDHQEVTVNAVKKASANKVSSQNDRVVTKMNTDAKVTLLPTVKNVKIRQYSTTSVKITWKNSKKNKGKYYKVCIAKTANGKFKVRAVTKKLWYRVKGLKKNQKYYYYIVASEKRNTVSETDSKPSKMVSMKMKNYTRQVVFSGDSITVGMQGCALPYMHFIGKKSTVASVGVNTMTFSTKKIENGKSCIATLIDKKPDRIYLMLGINEIHYRDASQVIVDYKSVVGKILKSSPKTEIVLLAVSPVTKSVRTSRPGFKQIPKFNKMLKKYATTSSRLYFYDYTSFLKDSNGCLKSKYAAVGGFHWIPAAYKVFANKIDQYEKRLDG